MGQIKRKYLGKCKEDVSSNPEFYMNVAEAISKKSMDPSTGVGACIVKKGKIISYGYNRPPKKWNIKNFPWGNSKDIPYECTKYPYICHAECTAICNAKKSKRVKNSTMYVTLFPCNECAKMMALYGIKRVVYKDKRPPQTSFDMAEEIFNNTGIEFIHIDEYKNKKVLTKKNEGK